MNLVLSIFLSYTGRMDEYVNQYRDGTLTGADLAKLVEEEKITKTERRNIVKLAKKPVKVLTQRQEWRLQVKEKKSQPRTTTT